MDRPSGLALQLSRIGARVSADFAVRVGELGLTPAQVGVLRVVGQRPGLSQQELAGLIEALPSRVTKLVDELEALGLLERVRSSRDRRNVELRLSSAAAERTRQLLRVVTAHDAAVTSSLSERERASLVRLLGKVAAGLGMSDEGHAGYRSDG